ncbi:transcription factor CP2-like protein 1 [Paramisgurnus dabryanus]|uniref:transcription factor CP2-like protein 1 n=1 Tax=Paramisgurnus dabryanus TaxID=90735 RepID=UPI0031F46132
MAELAPHTRVWSLNFYAHFLSEMLLPILKHEEQHCAESKVTPFYYELCAATYPAVKLQDETLTYLNQGQSYEIRMLNRKLAECKGIRCKYIKSIVRVVFHDRRLQYTEHQQLEGWRWNRPGDRILDLDVPLSVGIVDPQAHPLQLNTIQFLWDPLSVTSLSLHMQVNCISTEFTPRKHGGEKGVPFRIQIDTFAASEQGEYVKYMHSASCQVKVFKPKGADRRLKNDQEKIEKKSLQDGEKYQPSYKTTVLTECFPWPEAPSINITRNTPSPVYPSSPASYSFQEGCVLEDMDDAMLITGILFIFAMYLHRNRFSSFCRIFSGFLGSDLLKMSRDDFIQICGPADGICLFNTIEGVRTTTSHCLCISAAEYCRYQPHAKGGADGVYHALYLVDLTVFELTEKIANQYNVSSQQIHHLYRQGPTGIYILVFVQMVQNFTEETSFIISTLKDESNDGYHVVLK